jgi:AcrR family transcriptional regulator
MKTMPLEDAARLLAGWDGLQLQSLYAPKDVDVVAHLAARLGRAHPPFPRPDETLDIGALAAAVVADDAGYAPGRERRAAIVAAAMPLFSTEGFHHTSLREIAERTGIPKSTLLHHFASKDELLAAVLIHRDATTIPPAVAHPSARAELWALADGADANAASPGLIEVYTVLSSEGAAPEHPAHAYFEQRMRRSRASFLGLFDRLAAEGALVPGRDPVHEAVWLLALWDGLQLQWLYDRDAVDVGALLRAHFATLLT